MVFLPGLLGFPRVSKGFFWVFTGFDWVSNGFTEFYWVSIDF